MCKLHRKTGFTLIEITVVLIIVGILVAIGIPNLFIWFQRSKASEAILNMESYKDLLEGCIQKSSNFSCVPDSCMNYPVPQSPNFSYTAVNPCNGQGVILTISALPIPSVPGGGIYFQRTSGQGNVWTCFGLDPYAGVC
jgi:prepilin-type N-terminal cleavage/methylation domain-containing protein